MTDILEYVVAALLIVGSILGLTGSYGLLKLPQSVQRLHAPTKASTIGVGTALIAASLAIALQGGGGRWQEVLVTAFLFLTAPLSALFMAKTLLFRHIPKSDLPDPGTGTPWATFQSDARDLSPPPAPGPAPPSAPPPAA